MKKRLFAAFVSLCIIMSMLPTMVFAEGVQDSGIVTSESGLCEHHTQHDESCGYTEGTAEIPCSHEHNENCGGLTDPEACNHTHDEACDFVPATEGTPCTFVCEVCNAQDSGNPATPSDAQPEKCTCETLCTEEEVNADCPVCSAEGAELDKVCVGAALLLTAPTLRTGEIELYVGGQQIKESGCYENQNGTWKKVDGTEPANGQFSYDADTFTLTLNQAMIVNYQDVTVGGGFTYRGSVIAFSQSADVSLTIEVSQGTSNITGTGGIRVVSKAGDASLSISGPGSLEVKNVSNDSGIVLIGSKNVNLGINSADVTISNVQYYGVQLAAGDACKSTATINAGNLTVSDSVVGIYFMRLYTSGPSSLTVSGNAMVDTEGKTGGIINGFPDSFQIGADGESGGIVFNGNSGTVYGNVTLQEDLEIGTDETLTIGKDASLTVPDGKTLTNNGTIINNGTLTGEVGGSGTVTPKITTDSLPNGTVGEFYTATLEATGNNITWSASGLPDGLTLNSDGTITGTPTEEGTSTVTVKAENSAGSTSKDYTLIIKPATVPVTGLELNKNSLTLQEKGSDTLTVTVKPADATNQDVTWQSSNTSIATVSADGTVTAISAGNATITATAADGSGVSASCTLTVTHGKMVHIPKKDATCTEYGNEEYWICENCGKYFSDANGDTEIAKDSWIISAINHDWNDAVYTWSDDGSTCTATRTCKHDSAHTETSKATVTGAQTKASTCTEKGETTYTATFEADWAVTQTKVLADISATGHSYGKPVWSWSEDGKTCTVTFTCENDATHKESPKVTVTAAVKKPATCTETGVTTYTATVEFNGQTHKDTKDVADLPATGHSYGKPVWNWSEDGKTCTVTFTCEKDENHKESPKVDVTSAVKTPATCTETGVTTYTATVEFNGQTYTDTKDVADIPATGHSYDNGKCTVCGAIASDFKVIITAGANGSWQKGTKDGLTFTSNAAYKHFQKVQVDGKDLDASNYTVKEGSTIVTLKTSYLETLSVGKHTLAIVSETGTATTEFTIKAAASANDRDPANPNGEATESVQTGDNTNMMLWIVMLFVSASILGIAVYEKRKKHMEN